MSKRNGRNRSHRNACLAALASAATAAMTMDANALTFNLTYDANTTASPNFSQIQAATQYVANEYAADFKTNISINILCYQSSSTSLGESFTGGGTYSYAQILSALSSHINSPNEALAVSSLPSSDPTGGGSFYVPYAQELALGLGGASYDGHFAFNYTYPLNYNYNNRAVAGEYDFTGIAEHEFSEIMGRGSRLPGQYSVMDLFRYKANGVRSLSSTDTGAYLSLNGGRTVINTYNSNSGGDLGDWAGTTNDAYNAFDGTGVASTVSAGDITELDAIGYSVGTDGLNVYFKSPANNAFTTGSNWIGGSVPTSSQIANVNLVNPNLLVNVASNTTVGGFYAHSNTTLDMQGKTLTLAGVSGNSALLVSQTANDNCSLTLQDGTVIVNEPGYQQTSIGRAAGSYGSLVVGSGGTLTNNGALYVGESGIGYLTINSTASVTTNAGLDVGLNAGSTGAVYLNSGGTFTQNNVEVHIGTYGNGTIVQSGGTNNVNANLLLAVETTATGTYSLTGGTLNANGTTFIGYVSSGAALFSQTGGTSYFNSTVYVGAQGDYNSTFTVGTYGNINNTGLSANFKGDLVIGGAQGNLANTGPIFNIYGAYGTVGAASSTGANVYLGDGSYSRGDSNNVNGDFTIYGNLSIGTTSTAYGYYTSIGGITSATNIYVGDGGTGSLTSAIGSSGYSDIYSTNFIVGNTGVGTATIQDTFLTTTTLNLGSVAGASGAFYLTGSPISTSVTASSEQIGVSGTGVFNQSGGINTTSSLYIGYNSTALGTYVLSGSSSSLTVNGNETISQYATGTTLSGGAISPYGGVFIQSQGTHTVTGFLGLGRTQGSTGYYMLSGGSLAVATAGPAFSNGEIIGWGGVGTFIQSGGTNTVGTSSANQGMAIGFFSTGYGTYIMNNSSASLVVTGNLALGGSDTAAGGVGVMNISAGTATINGKTQIWGTPGSMLNVSGGTLAVSTVNNSGTFIAAGTLIETGNFTNNGFATFAGTQQWTSGTTLSNTGGTTTFKTDSGSTSASPLVVSVTGGTVNFASTQHLSQLTVTTTASVTNPSASKRSVLITPTLSVSGTLDLSGEDLDLQMGGSSGLTTIGTLVKKGFNNGTWTGTGITSSTAAADTRHITALGVIQNNQSGSAIYGSGTGQMLFDGISPAANDVLVKYTYYGDANLNGTVDGSDYSKIDNAYLVDNVVPGLLTGWFNGDFNYDNVINGSDYTLIDNAYNRQSGGLTSTALIAANTSQIAGSSVPEPTALAILALSVAPLLGRRRVRKF